MVYQASTPAWRCTFEDIGITQVKATIREGTNDRRVLHPPAHARAPDDDTQTQPSLPLPSPVAARAPAPAAADSPVAWSLPQHHHRLPIGTSVQLELSHLRQPHDRQTINPDKVPNVTTLRGVRFGIYVRVSAAPRENPRDPMPESERGGGSGVAMPMNGLDGLVFRREPL